MAPPAHCGGTEAELFFARFLPIPARPVPDLSRFFAISRLLVPARAVSQSRGQRPNKPLISAYLAG
jgi:hypothetical protein